MRCGISSILAPALKPDFSSGTLVTITAISDPWINTFRPQHSLKPCVRRCGHQKRPKQPQEEEGEIMTLRNKGFIFTAVMAGFMLPATAQTGTPAAAPATINQ